MFLLEVKLLMEGEVRWLRGGVMGTVHLQASFSLMIPPEMGAYSNGAEEWQ